MEFIREECKEINQQDIKAGDAVIVVFAMVLFKYENAANAEKPGSYGMKSVPIIIQCIQAGVVHPDKSFFVFTFE